MKHLLTALSLLASNPALACGQSTHVWIGIEAIQKLPDGDLKDLLSRADLFDHRVNGAMFPDGGYSPLTQDGYGETAHWEPFHTAYLEWIVEQYDPPYEGEAAAHVAFLMGLAAHGMADQIFDGVYLTRSLFYEQEAWEAIDGEVDLYTDVSLAYQRGAQPLVEDVVPYDAMEEVFVRYGQPTDPTVMQRGQASLRIAVQYVGGLGTDPVSGPEYDASLPWANGNLVNPVIPGSPGVIQQAVADYWLTLWDRLHERFDPTTQPVFHTWPDDGGFAHPREADDIESQVAIGLSRAVDLDTLTPRRVKVTDAAGAEHPISFRMYYGNRSNVLLITPTEDWAEDTVYTVTLGAGITSFDGQELTEPWSMSFSTGAAPVEVGCGCVQTPNSAPWALLGLVAWTARRRRKG